MPLVHGRDFNDKDVSEGPQAVAVVNQAFVDQVLGSSPALGREIRIAFGNTQMFTVVGVCGNTIRGGRAGTPVPEVIVPAQGRHMRNAMTLIVRTRGATSAPLAPLVREVIRDLDAELVPGSLVPLVSYLDNADRPRSVVATLIGLFAVLAVFLACVGTYSVMSYSVTSRGHEIGVRMALGAARANILRLILRQCGVIVTAGTIIGLAGAAASTRLLRAWLFGVTPTDPATVALAVVGMMVVAMAAAYVPARRATRCDPMVALREE